MTQEQRDKFHAYGASALFHIVVFVLVALTGIFAQAAQEKRPVVDVTVYDMAADSGGSGGGGSPALPPAADMPPAIDAVALPAETVKLPEIAEEYTKEPEKQQAYRETHRTAETPRQVFGAAAADVSGTASGIGRGSGDGTGSGAGEGAGTGEGSGTGNGSGNGTGDGSGSGRDEAAAKRPKTPPQFLGGKEPRYPRDLQEQGIGGTVLLRLTVTAEGSVAGVEIAGSSGYPALDTAAVKAAYSYSFAAARNIYDEPVMCIITKRIVFNP
ncbi:energy transducer TonB [Anaerovibrio sp.]|uniref:energy transducer TonB n=1 Tax=Anaerovibrio sp. TaxID=1872532 RepID=UPI003F14CBD1